MAMPKVKVTVLLLIKSKMILGFDDEESTDLGNT